MPARSLKSLAIDSMRAWRGGAQWKGAAAAVQRNVRQEDEADQEVFGESWEYRGQLLALLPPACALAAPRETSFTLACHAMALCYCTR